MIENLFLKAVALNFLFAFYSLSRQVLGLLGENGILSAKSYLNSIKSAIGPHPYLTMPTFFWWNSSDQALVYASYSGVILSIIAFFGIAPPLVFLLLYLLYLSFANIGQTFLSFQWDGLLLETGFITWLATLSGMKDPITLILLWLLMFRLIFSSGIAKLIHGSREWRDLTAMKYHYLTQPLPNRFAYLLGHQPLWFAKLSTLFVFFFELIAPLFIFSPFEVRIVAFGCQVLLQIMILTTGNFAFFNTLALALCIPLLETMDPFHFQITTIPAAILIGLNLLFIADFFIPIRQSISYWLQKIQFWHLINPYGLFVHMTTVRNELVVQGRDYGKEWKTYVFKYKPEDLYKAPVQCAPYHPRLDWQLWFSALAPYQSPSQNWLRAFLSRLLEGSPDVCHLLQENPFADSPPKMVRVLMYRYRFSSLATLRKEGKWWEREFVQEFSPTIHSNH